MYGRDSSGDGVRVRRWRAPDGSAVASATMKDGRTYRVVASMGAQASEHTRVFEVRLAAEASRAIEAVVRWDRG